MLLIDNKKLNVDLYDVLKKIHFINPAYLRIVKRAGSNVMCTCPFHGNHNEQHASCGVNNDRNSNARISAISDQVIFNTSNAIRDINRFERFTFRKSTISNTSNAIRDINRFERFTK